MLASFVLKAVLLATAWAPTPKAVPLVAVSGAAPVAAPVAPAVPANAQPRSSSPVSSQLLPATPQFRRYGVASGLPSGAVNAVAQDRDGLMWFATDVGLVRYDGVSFKVFRHVAADPLSIPEGPQFTLFVDRANTVWSGGLSSGLIAYDQASHRFRQWLHDDARPDSLAGDEVWSVAQTPDGQLWVASDGGLQRMRADGSGFDPVPLAIDGAKPEGSKPKGFGPTRALLAGSDGRLWIGAQSGLYVREPDGVIHRVPVDPAFHGDLGKIWHIDGDNGDVRIAVSGGLLVVGADGVARPLAPQQLASLRILSSTRDRAGRLWIGSADGVWLQDHSRPLVRIVGQPLLPGGLPGSKTWQTLLDSEGGLWITFDESSIAYLAPDWDGFTRYTHVPDDPRSLSGIVASALLQSRDGRLWVGGENGWIDKLDVRSGAVQHMVRGVRGQVISLAEDARSRLWINVPGGIQWLDHGTLHNLDLTHGQLQRPVLLCTGTDGRIYVATWRSGVFVIDPDTRAVAAVAAQPGSTQADAQPPNPAQLSVHGGQLWYASSDGLQTLDAARRQLVFVPGVARHGIDAMAFDASGFWTANQRQLEHYRYAGGKATPDASIDLSQQGFAPDLLSMKVDGRNQLWLFANPGLWRLQTVKRSFERFGAAQGLLNVEFGSGTPVLETNGVLLAPNSGGVIALQPAHLLQTAPPATLPALTLTRISVRRRGHDRQLLPSHETVRLGWRDRDLSIRARVASFIDPGANAYRFMLHGFDTGWVDVDSRGEREFAGLPAGDYSLSVMGAGADGVWARLPAPLQIHVESPPWLRWWAWLSYAALLLILLGLILRSWRHRLAQRHRMQLVEQQRQLAEAASAAKTQFLATLSHEFRTPMTGVMGMAELLLGTPLTPLQHDYTRAMQRSGGMLLKLLNDALDLARIEAGRLELEPAPFDPRQLVEDVAQLEQGLAHLKGIRFVLDVADDLPALLVGDAVRIKQVLLNLANNALKFTERGSVTLRVRRLSQGPLSQGPQSQGPQSQGLQLQGLQLSVIDTGPGIPEASQGRLFQRFEQEDGPQRRAGSGLGLAICRELVDMMGGSIELQSRLGHGSTFHVRLPLAQPPSSAVPTDARLHPRQLLLVEDDAIVATVIRGLLAQQGHGVCHVGNGLAALAELANASFDAVLLDLDLPGVDGFQVARLIRQREHADQRVPIIAVTARAGSEDEAQAMAVGMDGFLRKPLSGEQLADALAAVLRGVDATPAVTEA